MRNVRWQGVLVGLLVGLILMHFYHTKTAGPGTTASKSRGG